MSWQSHSKDPWRPRDHFGFAPDFDRRTNIPSNCPWRHVDDVALEVCCKKKSFKKELENRVRGIDAVGVQTQSGT